MKNINENINENIEAVVDEILRKRMSLLEQFATAYLAHLPGDPKENIARIELMETRHADKVTWHFRLKEQP